MPNQNSNSPRNASANNKMLIDATHPEETRVVVQRNGRVEEFDFESAARKLLRGNIYLAKVTRVEPSLQAAFVDYGGNRHGFLAFNEIHPDYYQIPIADRRALIEAETAAEAEEEAAADRAAEAAARRSRRRGGQRPAHPDDGENGVVDVSGLLPPEPADASAEDRADDGRSGDPHASAGDEPRSDDGEPIARSMPERSEPEAAVYSEPMTERDQGTREETTYPTEQVAERPAAGARSGSEADGEPRDEPAGDDRVETVDNGNGIEAEQIETVTASEDVLEEVPVRPRRRLRSYKIQEVIKRRQVLLVQVVKEERGTKGAALTTYLSLAGRYTVLMPNTARGGGISRKITNPQDRKRLKAIAAELDVPEGMGLIIRTAGAARTKQEIKRDYEYLLRLWESVRELALSSNAPALVYEEGNLIKRSIRDLYGKEVEEIIVAGDAAFAEARDFMRMLMPSHAKNVHFYEDPEPLFTRYGMERQLNAMFSPYVHLRSGGYLVINQTEALVAIDINSGKSTREFSIEETALSTNLEAADEIARQLKLRDLAGLIVIDFIDMEEKRNNRAVERRLKDALRHDRARIQLGRISHFGLLEMSRQRMRTGVLEGSTTQCPHCQGTGIIRSTESVALAVLRGLEDALMAGHPASLTATTTATVALYILNHKRAYIVEMENRYGITIQIVASEKVQGANFTIDRQARREEPQRRQERTAVNMDWGFEDDEQEADAEAVEDTGAGTDDEPREESVGGQDGGPGGDGRRRRRRRRGRRGDREMGGRSGSHDQGGGDIAERPITGRPGEEPQPYVDDGDEVAPHGGKGRYQPRRDDGEAENRIVEVDDTSDGDGDGDDDAGHARPARDEGQGQGDDRPRRRRRGRRGGRRNQERDRPHGDGEVNVRTDMPVDAEDTYAGRDQDVQGQSRVEFVPASAFDEPAPSRTPEPAHVNGNGAQPDVAVTTGHDEPVIQALSTPTAPLVEAAVAPAVAPPAETPPPPAPAPSPRSAPVASEPVLERVVVGPDASTTPVAEEGARPARRGWWQRR